MHIYKIYNKEELLYIGSTTDIERRKIEHKSQLKREISKPLYEYLKQNDIKFEELRFEEIICRGLSLKGLRYTEGNYIRIMNPLCNERIEGRTDKEYKKDNIVKIKEKDKEYRELNKKKIKECQKKWYNNNSELIKEQQKQYRESNVKKIKERFKKHYQQNRDLINKKKRERRELDKIFNKIYNHFY